MLLINNASICSAGKVFLEAETSCNSGSWARCAPFLDYNLVYDLVYLWYLMQKKLETMDLCIGKK